MIACDLSRFKNIALLLSTLLALGAPLFVAFQAHEAITKSAVARFDIEAYDPRDLLYGHYMTYKIKWNWADGAISQKACSGANCCLCLGAESLNPKASVIQCPVSDETIPAQCTHVVKGHVSWGDNFDIGINRVYLDEAKAPLLEKDLRNKNKKMTIGLAFPAKGQKPKIEKLYIDDLPLEDYLKSLNSQPK